MDEAPQGLRWQLPQGCPRSLAPAPAALTPSVAPNLPPTEAAPKTSCPTDR